MNSAELAYYERDVAGGKSDTVNTTGSVFVCEESTARFYVSFDDRQKIPCKGGFTFRFPDGFKKITLFNLSSSDTLTVNFFAGNSLVEYTYLRSRGTRVKPSDLLTINTEANATFKGVDAGNRRKSFQIQNVRNGTEYLDVQVQTDDGPPPVRKTMAQVPGATSPQRNWFEVETDADIIVYNHYLTGTGININYLVTETFYTT